MSYAYETKEYKELRRKYRQLQESYKALEKRPSAAELQKMTIYAAVSYTHLTLPTILLV